jgi:hypothetical protein
VRKDVLHRDRRERRRKPLSNIDSIEAQPVRPHEPVALSSRKPLHRNRRSTVIVGVLAGVDVVFVVGNDDVFQSKFGVRLDDNNLGEVTEIASRTQ